MAIKVAQGHYALYLPGKPSSREKKKIIVMMMIKKKPRILIRNHQSQAARLPLGNLATSNERLVHTQLFKL
jgi:hypothetical protein